MEKVLRIIIIVFFLILPAVLLYFVGVFANLMRWKTGSPLVPGYNWMRWSHLYLILGSLFCLLLYIPVVISFVKRRLKILLIPFFTSIAFIIFSIAFIIISRSAYYEQIIKKCDEDIKNNPSDSIPLEGKATAYDKIGKHEKAIELFTEALKITTNPAYVIHDRGLAYVNCREYDKAIQDFTKAIEMDSNKKDFIAQCYNDRGVAYFYSGQYDKSWQDVKTAIEMGYKVNPGFLSALESKGFGK